MQQLYRSRDNRVVAGVAAGMARYFNLDVSLVRLLWILSVILGGSGIIAYIIAWVVIPEEPDAFAAAAAATGEGETDSGQPTPQPRRDGQLGGVILIGLGFFFLVRQFLPANFLHYLWPLILIGLGLYLLLNRK